MEISILLIDGNLHLIFCVENVYGKFVDHESISPDLLQVENLHHKARTQIHQMDIAQAMIHLKVTHQVVMEVMLT
jgi:hypothetical protein